MNSWVGTYTRQIILHRTFFDPRHPSGNSPSQSRRSLRGPARWVAEVPRRRRGVHRDGLEEAVIPSSDGITLFGTPSPAIAFRAAPSERHPTTPPFSTVNERARQPDPNSLTDLAKLGCDFAFGHSLAAARKGHS